MSLQYQHAIRILLLILAAVSSGIAQSGTVADSTVKQQTWQYFDAPINPDTYLIRPGEKLLVTCIGTTLRPLELQVDAEGSIVDPGLGKYNLSYKTLAETRAILLEPLLRYYRAKEVVIGVAEARPVSIAVSGAVKHPGTYRAFSSQTVSDVIVLAGGLLPNGSRRRIEFSGGKATIPVDLERAFTLGDAAGDPPLYSGRNVFVPLVSGQAVFVQGEVFKPGTIELSRGDDLRTILRLAGGVRSTADTTQIHCIDDASPLAMGDSVPSGRHVVVPASAQSIQQRGITVSGAVKKPGDFAYTSGMTVDQAISATGGLTERANNERITVFRRAEDGRVLTNGADRYPIINQPSLVLQLFDSVVVPVKVGYVTVTGAAYGSRFLPYVSNKSAGFYIDAAGGVPKTALSVTIVRISRVTGLHIEIHPTDIVSDGDEIIVSWTGGSE